MEDTFEVILEKVYQWIGSCISSCPVRDGVTFYNEREKVFKVVQRRGGWHLQFNIPVPETEGLTVYSIEEARSKKLGRSRWIYKGNSDAVAEYLIRSALASLTRKRLIEPAMSRDSAVICGKTCPCFKKMERLLNNKNLPENCTKQLYQAYDLLRNGYYSEFVALFEVIVDDFTNFLLSQRGINSSGSKVQEKIDKLVEIKVIPLSLKREIEVIFTHRQEKDFSAQVRAYPTALMLIAFMNKLLKVCV